MRSEAIHCVPMPLDEVERSRWIATVASTRGEIEDLKTAHAKQLIQWRKDFDKQRRLLIAARNELVSVYGEHGGDVAILQELNTFLA